jgi:hypothetical protein
MSQKDGVDPVQAMKERGWGEVEIQLQSLLICTLDVSRQSPASTALLSATGTE